jgi:hypothetical protein
VIELPPDSFLVRHNGKDGYGAQVVVGRDEAIKVFADLFGSKFHADAHQFASKDANWSFAQGHPIALFQGEVGDYGEIIRITFPEGKAS